MFICYNRKLFFLIILISLFTSCKYSEKDKVFQYSNEFSINYPSYMRKSGNFANKSLFEAGNSYRGVYLLVAELENDKSLSFNEFFEKQISLLSEGVKEPSLVSSKDTTFNGIKAKEFVLIGTVDDKKIRFITVVSDTKPTIYQISGWMFQPKKELWESDIRNAIYSFKIINNN